MMKRALLTSVLVFAACKTAPEVVAEVTPPSVPQEDFVVVTQNLTQVDIKYTGTIAAGTDSVTVEKAAWEFVVDGTVKRSGEAKLGLSAPAGQTVEFALAESLTYVKDEEELKAMDARGGSLLLAMRGTLFVTVPVPAEGDKPAGKRTVELPFAKSKEVKTPAPAAREADRVRGRALQRERGAGRLPRGRGEPEQLPAQPGGARLLGDSSRVKKSPRAPWARAIASRRPPPACST